MSPPLDRPTSARLARSPIDLVFVLLALGFAAAALYHGAAIVVPSIAEPSPAWRHGLFAVINGAVGLLLLRRPPWFAAAFAVLAIQQLWSHGAYGWAVWRDHHRVDWASVLVLAAVPVIAGLLANDARAKLRSRRGEPHR